MLPLQRHTLQTREYVEVLRTDKKECRMVVDRLRHILANDTNLSEKVVRTINKAAADNSDLQTNPVRSLDDLYIWLARFLTVMPWEGLTFGAKNKEQRTKTAALKEQGLFRRIDQSIGYQYYIFGDLQYEPQIAEWLHKYNAAWAEHLNSSESWNNEYYELLKSDPLFELDSDKYESPDHWHTWNDFFSRRLNSSSQAPWVAEGTRHGWLPIDAYSRLQVPEAIKTTDIFDIKALLGNSRYNDKFANGSFTHITLDMYNYHHFHSPVDGRVLDIQEIDGLLTSGGEIIWDAEQNRYRYRYDDNLGYQMIEKRVVIVMEQRAKTAALKEQGQLVAIVPIGVAQVGSVCIEKDIQIDAEVHRGQDLGHFLCGGSDVIVMEQRAKTATLKEQRPSLAEG